MKLCSPKWLKGFAKIWKKLSSLLVAIEAPQRTHMMPTVPMETKLIIIMFNADLARVMPP